MVCTPRDLEALSMGSSYILLKVSTKFQIMKKTNKNKEKKKVYTEIFAQLEKEMNDKT